MKMVAITIISFIKIKIRYKSVITKKNTKNAIKIEYRRPKQFMFSR